MKIEPSESQVLSAFKHIQSANKSLPNDKSIKALFDEIKARKDQIDIKNEETKEQAKPATTTRDKLLSRVKIDDEPLIEEVKEQPKPYTVEQPQVQQPQIP